MTSGREIATETSSSRALHQLKSSSRKADSSRCEQCWRNSCRDSRDRVGRLGTSISSVTKTLPSPLRLEPLTWQNDLIARELHEILINFQFIGSNLKVKFIAAVPYNRRGNLCFSDYGNARNCLPDSAILDPLSTVADNDRRLDSPRDLLVGVQQKGVQVSVFFAVIGCFDDDTCSPRTKHFNRLPAELLNSR